MNPNQIFEDFERKYQGSFVQVSMNGNKSEIFQFRSMRTLNKKFPELELQSDILGTIILNYNTQAKIFFRIPKTGFIQYKDQALFFSRRPERQWKRGIHQNNCQFDDPTLQFNMPRGGNNNPCFIKVREAFDPTYHTLAHALELINQKGFKSVALSRNMAIAKRKKESTEHTLWYRYAAIGTVDQHGNIKAPSFETEVHREIK